MPSKHPVRARRVVNLRELGSRSPFQPLLPPAQARHYTPPAPVFGRAQNWEIFSLATASTERWLTCLEDVDVHGNDGIISIGDRYLDETAWIPENITLNPAFNKRSWLPARRVSGTWFSCLLYWGSGYYHWICDVLCRLYDVLDRLPADTRFLVPAAMQPWMWRTLELLGIPAIRCTPWSGRRRWRIERLLHATPVAMTGDQSPAPLTWVREAILAGIRPGPAVIRGDQRFYLSRSGARSRHVINEKDFIPQLRERGFQVVDCSSLTVEEQVRLFADAHTIVAPHGAALTNLLWCQPGTRILELFEPSTVRRCYWLMAQNLGHRYRCGLGTSCANAEGEPNLIVSSDALLAAVDDLLASPSERAS